MTNIKFSPKGSPCGDTDWPEFRWGRDPQTGPERRDQSNLTPNHGAGGSDFSTGDAALVIPGRAEEVLQIIVRPGQAWHPVRREEVRSVTRTDLQKVPEWLRKRARTARFLFYTLHRPVELTFDRLRGVIAEVGQNLRRLQHEAVGRLDLGPSRLFLLQRPVKVTVQQDKIPVYLPGPPFCVSRTWSSDASICSTRSFSCRPLATSGGRPSSVNALRTARQ